MFRLIAALLFASASAYADPFGFCNCPPGLVVLVNGTNYSNSFQAITPDGGITFQISGTIVNPIFNFSLDITTHPDTDIDFETSISGDPTVAIIITQAFVGGPIFRLDTQSSGAITDLDGNGHASALGSPFIQTTYVNGILADEMNTGCDITSTPGFSSECPSPIYHSKTRQYGGEGSILFPAHGVLEMNIGFNLTDGDKLTVRGSATLPPESGDLVPEPATFFPMVAGLSALAAAAWRRRVRV